MKSFKRYILENEQEYDSAKTSLPQIAKTFKAVNWKPNTVNLDYGGGKYDYGTDYLEIYNVKNLVYDKYNRSAEHNQQVMDYVRKNQVDTVTCNNVLNVIKEDSIQNFVIKDVYNALKTGGTAYFLIHEGNGSGVGKPTIKGWQNNQKTIEYIPKIQAVFHNITRKGNLIIAKK